MLGTGECLCGAVRFSAESPSIWSAHCHCTMCQRAHGAAFVTWVGVEVGKSEVRDPDGVLSWYDSSDEAQRGFCSRCGSSLFFRSSRWPGELHIARAGFTGPVDRAPEGHDYYDTRVEWFAFDDDLPKSLEPEQA
ncbi:GFA family protein [soil metagenome]